MVALLKLVSTNDDNVGLDSDNTKEALTEGLDSLSVVSSYSHAMLNTTINPVTQPPASWYTTLNNNLGTAKTHALQWLTDFAPKIGSTIPQTIINYDITFQAATNEILSILANAGSRALTKDEKHDIIDLVEATLESIEEQKSTVKSVNDGLVKLFKDFQADHTALAEGKDSAANAVALAQSEQSKIEDKITELQTKLAAARQKVTSSGIGLGLSIFIAVAAFALAVATGGAAAAVVVCAVGVIGVGVSATFTGIFSAEINGLLDEIRQEQVKLADQKRQVVALQGLVNTIKGLKEQNEAAKTALSNVQTMWSTLSEKYDGLLKELKAENVDMRNAVQRMHIKAARDQWTDVRDWAKRIQAAASGTQVTPIVQHKNLMMAV